MRRLLALVSLPIASSGAFAACSASSSNPGSSSSTLDAGSMADARPPQPQTTACQGDATACLSGTLDGSRVAAVSTYAMASLFRVFPNGGAMPIASEPVALDGTWAFSAVPAWSHYYVQIDSNYNVGGATPATIPSVVGPLTVPWSGPPLTMQVKPVQLQVFESRGAGGTMQVKWASANVYDPGTGDKLTGGAQVAIQVGGTTTTMPWGTDLAGKPAYFLQFQPPPAAQASYTVTTSATALGSAPLTWKLVADAPTFDGTVTSPANGATVPVNKSLTVTWGAQPSADFEAVELFFSSNGSGGPWTGKWASPAPDAPDATQEIVPAAAFSQPGSYLLNVGFSKASCPATADGCVYASAVAGAQLTAQ